MGRSKQVENKQKREELEQKNSQIKYQPTTQNDSGFFKNLSKYFFIVIFFSVAVQIYNLRHQMKNGGDYQEQNTMPDISAAHRDVHKFQKESLRNVKDIEFMDDEVSKEIINYYEKWAHIELHPQIHYDTGMQFNTGHMGFKNDFDHCKKSDLYKLQHPETIYENYYMLTDFAPYELPRIIAKDFGYDVHPSLHMGVPQSINNSRKYDFSLKTALINSRISRFHHFHHFGQCLFCVFQTSNHIPGKWAITGKDMVINNLRTYEQKNFKNPEQCKKTITFMPPSYRLYDLAECKAFFEHLDSPEYAKTIKDHGIGFILKYGRDIHRGEGIELVLESKVKELKNIYQNGKKCGLVAETVQAQTYIANPMLYKKHKIEVRIYFLIASVNPLIVYSQNLAHLRMCSVEFEKYSLEKEVHVCNVAVSGASGNSNFVVDFSLDGLRDYLIEEGVISNPNWIEEEIYPQIYKAITHLVRLGEHDFLKDSRVNENFALDFLLDDNSKIWFMENNPNPQIMNISDSRVLRHYIMFGDMFEIQFKYLRSRFKRLQTLARDLKEAILSGEMKKREKEFKQKFLKANKNILDKEFQLDPKNTYHKVYDETLEGADIFCGNLPEACLYQNE